MPVDTHTLRSVELWDTVECDSGVRERVFPEVLAASEDFDLDGTERLSLTLTRAYAYWDDLDHNKVIRTTYYDDTIREWRIREIEDGHDADGEALVKLECDSIRFDLINEAELLERYEFDGSANTHFEYYGLTPEQHIEVILAYAPSYFTIGTVEFVTPVDMIYHDDTPLSALSELAAITGGELEIERNGATDYLVNLVAQVGSTADTVEIRHGGNLVSAKRQSDSTDMGTRIYVRGGQTFGREGTMAGAAFPVALFDGTTIKFADKVMIENDQLNGYYVLDTNGTAYQITDSVAPDTIITASAIDRTDVIDGRLRIKRLYTDPDTGTNIYADLTYLELPSAVAAYGIKPSLLERSDIPGINNYLFNPLFSLWSFNGMPTGYYKIGNCTVTRETSSLYTRHGGSSAKIVANAGDGIASTSFVILPSEANPYLVAQAQLFVEQGHVRMELSEGVTQLVFPPPDKEAETITEGGWIDSFGINPGAEPDDNWYTRFVDGGAGYLAFRIKFYATVDNTIFYLDAAQVTRTPSFTETFYGGFASNDLWKLGLNSLSELSTPAEKYDVDIIDFRRLDPENYSVNEIVLGGAVRIVDTEADIDFTTRIISVTRNLLVEGDTSIEVADSKSALSRILGQSSRRTRAPVDTTEGGDAQEEPSSDTNIGAGITGANCAEYAAEYCSADSAGPLDIHDYTQIDLEENSLAIGDSIAWGFQGKVTQAGPVAGGGETNPEGTLKRTASTHLFYQDGWNMDNMDISNWTVRSGDWSVVPQTIFGPYTYGTKYLLHCSTSTGSVGDEFFVEADMTPVEEMWIYGRYAIRPAYWDASCNPKIIAGDGMVPIGKFVWDGVDNIDEGIFGDWVTDTSDTGTPCGYLLTQLNHRLYYAASGVWNWLGTQYSESWVAYHPTATVYIRSDWVFALKAFNSSQALWVEGTAKGTAGSTALSGNTGVAAICARLTAAGYPANYDGGIAMLLVADTDEIVCTNLPTGYKIVVVDPYEPGGEKYATESSGTATVNAGGGLGRYTYLEVRDGSNNRVARISPSNGVLVGDTYYYDSTGSLSDTSGEGVLAAVDLEFYNSSSALISTAEHPGVKEAGYTRGTATTVIPDNTAYIVPTAERKGAGTGIACIKQLVVNIGTVAAVFRPCETTEIAQATAWRVPTSQDLVLHLPFDDPKHPKCPFLYLDGSTYHLKRPDFDGSIQRSRSMWDASTKHNHHVACQYYLYYWGSLIPGSYNDGTYDSHRYLGGADNPLGDWIYDAGFFVEGVNGYAWAMTDWNHSPEWDTSNYGCWPGGALRHHPYHEQAYWQTEWVPEGEDRFGGFNQMYDFTYTFWFRPRRSYYYNYALLGMYEGGPGYGTNWYGSPLEAYTSSQLGGWSFYYNWDAPTNAYPSFFIKWWPFDSSDSASDRNILEIDSTIPDDPRFDMHAYDTNPATRDGELADEWCFVALRCKRSDSSQTAAIETIEYSGAGGSTATFATTKENIAFSFTPTADFIPKRIGIHAQRTTDTLIAAGAEIRATIYTDSSGSPGTQVSAAGIATVPALYAQPTADDLMWLEFDFNDKAYATGTLSASTTYWVVLSTASVTGYSGTNTIRVVGTASGNPNSVTKSGTGSWSTESFDAHFKLQGWTANAAHNLVDWDVWLGHPSTGELTKISEVGYSTNSNARYSDGVGANVNMFQPAEFGPFVTGTQHTIGQEEELPYGLYGGYLIGEDPGYGAFDEVKRWNRALSDEEVEGAFRGVAASSPTEMGSASIHDDVAQDTNDGGESAISYDPRAQVPLGGIIGWHRNISTVRLTSSSYQWTASGSGTNEWYVEASGGGDPSLTDTPLHLLIDGVRAAVGYMGGLADQEWDFGDNDTLGYNTVYWCNGTDPDSDTEELDLYYMDTLPPEYAECNGQTLDDPDSPFDGMTLPNLNDGDFLKGNPVSGTTSAGDAGSGSAAIPSMTVIWAMRVR